MVRRGALVVVVLALFAVCHAGDKYGFDSQQGFIPNDCPGCRVEVDIPNALEDGMIVELNAADTWACGNTREWRITEYAPDKFFAAALIPLPDPLVLMHGDEHPFRYSRLKDADECDSAPLERAPVEDAHEVLRTEDCERVLYDQYPEEIVYRGIGTGSLTTYSVNRRVLSEFRRWLIKVTDSDSVVGYTLVVVEEFAPEHGNARWHARQYDDVTEYSCPPGDNRDIFPLEEEAFDTHSMEEAHRIAASRDYHGEPPIKAGGMRVTPSNGATRWTAYGSRSIEIMDFATGDQTHRVVPMGRSRCVATARMILSEDPSDEDVKALKRRMAEEDKIFVSYTPVWRSSPVWYRREETSGEVPEEANFVFQNTRSVSYRGEEQPADSVVVPSQCAPAPSAPPRRSATRRR